MNSTSSPCGCGRGITNPVPKKRPTNAVPLDIANLSPLDNIVPVGFDGTKIPFDDGEVDAALLLFVLHHANEPIALVSEARRAARSSYS